MGSVFRDDSKFINLNIRSMLESNSPLEPNAEGNPSSELWYALHTRPRCEKRLESWMLREGFSCYLPTQKKLRIYPSKKVVFELPLFPGYLFGSFPSERSYDLKRSDFIANILKVNNQKQFLDEMENVRLMLSVEEPIESCPFLDVGRRVRVSSGKMRGLEGVVLRKKGRTKLVISVEMFHQSVCVEVDPLLLTPCL